MQTTNTPRRYMQGTLDYACGIYAVINAIALSKNIELAGGRYLYQETMLALATKPEIFKNFMRNETDHYWLVRHLFKTWCSVGPWSFKLFQPFSECLLPTAADNLAAAQMFLPEKEEESGPKSPSKARQEAEDVWLCLKTWFDGIPPHEPKRTAIVRFHRFVPNITYPVVSHWTTIRCCFDDTLILFDASSEKSAIFSFKKETLLPDDAERAMLRIVPESIVLIEA